MSASVIPPVEPVAPGADRPRWSVVIPTYDCAVHLGPCLESVLAQLGAPGFGDPEAPVEIVVVDDRSSDDPEAVVRAVGGDRVRFVRNADNLGAIGNFNACLAEARGEFVHLLHGDDLSEPGFYEAAAAVFAREPDIATFVARATYVDEAGLPAEITRTEVAGSGRWDEVLDVLTVSNRIRPPAVAIRRSVLEEVGGFRTDLPHAADWEMWVRLAAAAPVWFEDRSLARYRRHSASDTAGRVLSGANIDERLRCIDLLLEVLPPDRRAAQGRRARAYSALFAARTAARLIVARRPAGAARQSLAALRCLVAAARS